MQFGIDKNWCHTAKDISNAIHFEKQALIYIYFLILARPQALLYIEEQAQLSIVQQAIRNF